MIITAPRWVIDTQQQCIVARTAGSRYMALSYTWEASTDMAARCSQEPLVLTSSNLQEFQEVGFLVKEQVLDRIPHVIQHAMHLTAWLDERYLWVDRLCIVQDDAHTSEQVSQMNHVYAGAYLTIVAAAPSHMYQRFTEGHSWVSCQEEQCSSAGSCAYCVMRRDLPEGPSAHASQDLDEDRRSDSSVVSWTTDEDPEHYRDNLVANERSTEATQTHPDIHNNHHNTQSKKQNMQEKSGRSRNTSSARDSASEPHHTKVKSLAYKWYKQLSRSAWSKRGWTYQEHILCARAIVFCGESMFFECQLCLWDDVYLGSGQDDGSTMRVELSKRWNRWWPDFSFYLDLICTYNGRDFTYPQDALAGVSGILNALAPSFLGGFLCGLPRAFLDHSLLWQPYGCAHRRIDRPTNGTKMDCHIVETSSLPSWSWCGWQCAVDPSSMLSGLAYLGEGHASKRAKSWRTRKLVDWHTSDDQDVNGESLQPVEETMTFEDHVRAMTSSDILPKGWARIIPAVETKSRLQVMCVHNKDPTVLFKHPVPLKDDLSPDTSLTTQSYLTCRTKRLFLNPAAVLTPRILEPRLSPRMAKKYAEKATCLLSDGGPHISVFENPMFKKDPVVRSKPMFRDNPLLENSRETSPLCPVLVLQEVNGSFAGLLRLMDHSPISGMDSLEVIGISYGTASGQDMAATYEWQVYWNRTHGSGSSHKTEFTLDWTSQNGPNILTTNLAMAFTKTPTKHVQQKASSFHTSGAEACEFFNVLWIERRGKTAYRRACGWVPAHVWEANISDPIEVTLR